MLGNRRWEKSILADGSRFVSDRFVVDGRAIHLVWRVINCFRPGDNRRSDGRAVWCSSDVRLVERRDALLDGLRPRVLFCHYLICDMSDSRVSLVRHDKRDKRGVLEFCAPAPQGKTDEAGLYRFLWRGCDEDETMHHAVCDGGAGAQQTPSEAETS